MAKMSVLPHVGDSILSAVVTESSLSKPYGDALDYKVTLDFLAPSMDGLNGVNDFLEQVIDGSGPVIVKCAHCGQWGARKTACKHCGAPID